MPAVELSHTDGRGNQPTEDDTVSIWSTVDGLDVPERDNYTLEPTDRQPTYVDVATTWSEGIRFSIGDEEVILLPDEARQVIAALGRAVEHAERQDDEFKRRHGWTPTEG